MSTSTISKITGVLDSFPDDQLISEPPSSDDTTMIQEALDAGGKVLFTGNGIYTVSKTLFIAGGTHLDTGAATIKLADNSDCNVIRNNISAGLLRNTDITGDGTDVVITEPGHNKAVDDYVLIASGKATDATFEGEFQVTAVTATTWTVANAVSGNPTNWMWVHHNYVRLASTAFSGDGTTITVTEASHKRQPGDFAYITGLSGTGTWGGQYQIDSTVDGSWTFLANGTGTPTGTAKVMGERDIKIIGNFDANKDNNSGYEANNIPIYIIGASHIEVAGQSNNSSNRSLALTSVVDAYVPHFKGLNTLVCIQVEGFWNGVSINNVTHNGIDDCIAFTQVSTTGTGTDYSMYASPFGIKDSDNAVINNITGAPSLTMVKITGSDTYSMGSMVWDGVWGEVRDTSGLGKAAIPVRIIDDDYLIGGSADLISIKNIDVTQPSAQPMMLFNMSGGVKLFSLSDLLIPESTNFILFHTKDVAAAQSTIDKFLLEKYTMTAPAIGVWINIGALAELKAFTISDMLIKSGNIIMDDATSGVRLGHAASRIDRMTFSDVYATQETAGSRNSHLFYQDIGICDTINFNNVRCYGMGNTYRNSFGADPVTAAVGVTINFNNVHTEWCSNFVAGAGAGKYNALLSNVRIADLGSNVFQPTAGDWKIRANSFQHVNQSNNQEFGREAGSATFLFTGAATTTVSVNGASIPLDISAYGGANVTLAPIRGDLHWAVNATPAQEGVAEYDGTNHVNLRTGTTVV